MALAYIKMEHLLKAPKIWPKVINGIMNILNKIETIIILLSNWFEIVRFFESMPYFSYQTIQKYRKFPRVSIIVSETINNMISPGWGVALIFVSEWLKFMMVFKLQLSKVIWLVMFIIAGIIFQLRTNLFETQEISSKFCQTLATSLCNLEPVCCKKQQKKVPDQLLVCGIGDFWRTWMIPNWLIVHESKWFPWSSEVPYFTNQ